MRTTIRSLKREEEVRQTLKDAGADAGERLSFVAADLMKDEGWREAVAGCTYVVHVASPFPIEVGWLLYRTFDEGYYLCLCSFQSMRMTSLYPPAKER